MLGKVGCAVDDAYLYSPSCLFYSNLWCTVQGKLLVGSRNSEPYRRQLPRNEGLGGYKLAGDWKI